MEVISPNPQLLWVPVHDTDIAYVGQVVYSIGEGVANLATASGAADTTNKSVPFGVVVATSNRTQTFDATYKANSITGVLTQAAQVARDNAGVGGVWPIGDPQPYVQVALITPDTILRARIYKTTLGTAPTVLTVTTGSTTGLGFTSNACDFTPVADLCTTYCRSGANMGIYRVSDDTSTTVETNDRAFPQDIAVGDTFVRVPLRINGTSYAQTDGEALFLNCAAGPATDYWVVEVVRLDLSKAGGEFADFRFGGDHFAKARA